MTDFQPSAESPTGSPTEEDLLCLIENDESLLCRQFHSRPRPNWVTQISGEIFYFFGAYGKHDEWIALVVASGQVCMISSETSQVVGPADLDPSSAADCCAYVHPELRVDALTSQAGGNEHSLITVTWESGTLLDRTLPQRHKSLCFTARLDG